MSSDDIPAFPNVSYLFRRDGIDLVLKGGSWHCRCPFHQEKTPSCVVNDQGRHAGRYHCFGCGASGSAYDYLMNRHSMSFPEALAEIRRILCLPPDSAQHPYPLNRQKKPAPTASEPTLTDTLAPAQPEAALHAWRADCARLLRSQDDLARLAEWRGLETSLFAWAAQQQLIGLRPASGRFSYGRVREAFPVTRPRQPHETSALDDPTLSDLHPPHGLLIGTHIRLAPGTPGNERGTRPSYRFDPVGIGSWPYVIGDPAAATWLFFCEGQWDALALIYLLGWHQRPQLPPNAAIIALRGARNWRLWLHHQPLRRDATAFLFPDRDLAGGVWLEDPQGRPTFVQELCWIDETTPRIARAHAIGLPGDGKDLNDAVKNGSLTPEQFRHSLRPLFIHSRQKSVGKRGTFRAFCEAHKGRQDDYGLAARDLLADTTRPRGNPTLKRWVRHWHARSLSDQLATALLTLYHAWHTRTPLPPPPMSSTTHEASA